MDYGQPVTLTASLNAGATGKVTFYDGVTILGVAPISGNQATLTTIMLPSGKRSLSAYYQGGSPYVPSSTPVVQETVVAGVSLGMRHPFAHPASEPFNAFAVGDFNGDGKLDFAAIGRTGYYAVLVFLGNGDGTFQPAVSYSLHFAWLTSVTAGDFDGDGCPDLAVTGYSDAATSSVAIMKGNGDGTFQAPVNFAVANQPTSVAVSDFNGDGIADLAVATEDGYASVLLGNSDGSFKPAVGYAVDSGAIWVGVADFNGDGYADLAVVTVYGKADILLGKGDGTFQAAASLSPSSYQTESASITDFNGDGKPDLAVPAYYGGVNILLGNGDGTISAPVTYGAGAYPYALAAEDFNGDGKEDVAFVSPLGGNAGVMLGNGDGTFQPVASYSAGVNPAVVGLGDFNGDGRPDLIVGSTTYAGFNVLLGGAAPDLTIAASNGGGFTQGQVGAYYAVGVRDVGEWGTSGAVEVGATLPSVFTPTSIGGSGWMCALATLACTRSDALAAGAAYPVITIKGNIAAGAAGNITAVFTVSGGGDESPANNTVADTANTITLSASPNPALLGQAVTLTATIAAGATGAVTFYSGSAFIGGAAVAGGQAVLTTYALPPGSASLWAEYDGDSNYGPSSSAARTVVVVPGAENGVLPYTSYRTTETAIAIVAADFNGDGHLDLATAEYQGIVSVFLGNADGTFRPELVSADAENPPNSLVAGDFNNDGKADLAIAGYSGITAVLGKGDGTFTAGATASVSGGCGSEAAADFNGDGKQDLAAMCNNAAVVFLGNGDGTFQPGVTVIASGTSFTSLALADMNSDGKMDLVVLNGRYPGGAIVLLGNGDGTFQSGLVSPSIGNGPWGFAVGDFNGDGKPDVAILDAFAVYLLPGNGDGTLGSPITSPTSAPQGSIAVGDFNGDGRLDLAYHTDDAHSVSLVFGNGNGTFQPGITLPADGVGGGIAQGDFNGDGRLDFALVDYPANDADVYLGGQFSGLSISATHAGRFTVGQTGAYRILIENPAFGATSGTVTVTDALPAGFSATSISGSGWTCTLSTLTCTRSDALTTALSYPAITIAVSVGAGLSPSTVTNKAWVSSGSIVNTAADPTRIVSPSGTTVTVTPSQSTLGQTVILLANVTSGATGTVEFSDWGVLLGATALVIGQATFPTRLLFGGPHSLTATYSSLSGLESATVTAAQASGLVAGGVFNTGGGPYAVAAADFNGDGKTDLATANRTTNTVSVLLGDGTGAFGANADFAVGAAPIGVVTGDFNLDGITDIATVNSSGNTVSILLGNGNGTFQPAVNYAAGNGPASLAVGDFNGDGKADLAVSGATVSGSGCGILLGNGDGTFQAAADCGSEGWTSVLTGDFNGDGKADLGYEFNTNEIFVLLGNGGGTFQPVPFNNSLYVYSMAAGDLNGDGKEDLVVASFCGPFTGDYCVLVLLGNGDGTFQPYQGYPTSAVSNLALADVNGDGKLDVIGVDPYITTASVLFGNGDGTLKPQVSYPGGASPGAVVAGDFNGDGRTDLAIANNATNSVSVLLGVYPPSLSVASSHLGRFAVGETGAVYTIGVANDGPGPTAGAVTIADALPAGLAATAISGSGWSCSLAALTCERSDALAGGASYPAITLTVNVTATLPGSVTNHVSVLGGGSPAAAGNDLTSIDATYSYLVGDVAPYTSAMAPNFGDAALNILDLIEELFAVNAVPGFAPAACTDRLDAMDAYPPDTATTRGGDGVLDIRDLILELFRVNNLDTARPVRTSLGGALPWAACASASSGNSIGPTAASRKPATPERIEAAAQGALVLGRPEQLSATEERVPVYLEAAQDLLHVAVTFGLGDRQSQLRFVATAVTPPSLVQDGQLGVVAAAWLDGVSVRAGERLLLGYVSGPASALANLKVYGVSASGLDDNREVRLDVSTEAGMGRQPRKLGSGAEL